MTIFAVPKKGALKFSSNFSTKKAKVGRENSYSVKKVISSDSPLAKLEFKNPTCCFFRSKKKGKEKVCFQLTGKEFNREKAGQFAIVLKTKGKIMMIIMVMIKIKVNNMKSRILKIWSHRRKKVFFINKYSL